jgi:hypothetical protein
MDWCPRSQIGRIRVFTGWYEADGMLNCGGENITFDGVNEFGK